MKIGSGITSKLNEASIPTCLSKWLKVELSAIEQLNPGTPSHYSEYSTLFNLFPEIMV